MFTIQKFISLSIFSPLLIILILLIIGFSITLKKRKTGMLLIFIGLFLYFSSTNYFIDKLLYPLESSYPVISQEQLQKGEIYVLLGGGLTLNTAGGNVPTVCADSRIMATAQYYLKYPKKIFISGGFPLQNTASESSIYKEQLLALGVKEKDIIIEEQSKTTMENAKYIGQELQDTNIKSFILITSAFHMKRSVAIFKKSIPNTFIYPAPCNFLASFNDDRVISFIPSYYNFVKLQFVIWEIVGNLYYKIKY